MKSCVVQSAKAQRDVVHIAVYLGEQSPRAACRFLDAVDKTYRQLADMPALGGLCDYDHPELSNHRLWPIRKFKNYLILYRTIPDGIEIVRVFHAARDFARFFESH